MNTDGFRPLGPGKPDRGIARGFARGGYDVVAARIPKEEPMPEPSTPSIFRVRELTVVYKPQRLHAPFADSLSKPEGVVRLAGDILEDAATEVFLVLHLTV